MGDAARQPAERFHFLGPAYGLLHALSFGDIRDGLDDMCPAVGRDGFGPLDQQPLVIETGTSLSVMRPVFTASGILQNEHGVGQPAIFSWQLSPEISPNLCRPVSF